MKICDNCKKRPAMHTIGRWWKTPQDEYLCCICYVRKGNPPADWHLECVKMYNKIKNWRRRAQI